MMKLTRRNILIAGLIGTTFEMAGAKTPPATPARILTACFSLTGNTALIAGHITGMVGGDSFDIVPADPYPESYEQTVAQAREERARNDRPPLRRQNDLIGNYDTIILGYPIWAMTLPSVMRTFLDEHDLSGKTVVPFCTHKGYGRGESMRLIQAMAPQARLLEGFDVEGIHAKSSHPAVTRWLREIRLVRT